MAVYLLHIVPPLGHSAHYVGYCADGKVEERLEKHRRGQGAVLIREAVARGSTVELVHLWPTAPKAFERKVKGHGGAGRWCPACGRRERGLPKLANPALTTI